MSKRSREESGWCTIESDPGVFTLLIEKLGVKGVQVEELYDLDDLENIKKLEPIFGFIFLFKWKDSNAEAVGKISPESQVESTDLGFHSDFENIFFAQQEINNACATQAIMHILLNLPKTSTQVVLGDVLENFGCFAKELPADMRGLCLSNSLEIREIHNEFGNLSEILAFGEEEDDDDLKGEEKEKKKKSDPFHFVAFIEKNGKIYELDGLKTRPICHGTSSGGTNKNNSTDHIFEIIKKRISVLSVPANSDATESEVRFNLMAIVPDRRPSLRKELDLLSLDESDPAVIDQKFIIEQDLMVETAKWNQYRKEWSLRREECEKRQHSRSVRLAFAKTLNKDNEKNKIEDSTAASIGLSSQVQDLLKSLANKGLIPK